MSHHVHHDERGTSSARTGTTFFLQELIRDVGLSYARMAAPPPWLLLAFLALCGVWLQTSDDALVPIACSTIVLSAAILWWPFRGEPDWRWGLHGIAVSTAVLNGIGFGWFALPTFSLLIVAISAGYLICCLLRMRDVLILSMKLQAYVRTMDDAHLLRHMPPETVSIVSDWLAGNRISEREIADVVALTATLVAIHDLVDRARLRA